MISSVCGTGKAACGKRLAAAHHLALLLAIGSSWLCSAVQGDVVVVVNRTGQPVDFVARTPIAPPQTHQLDPGQLVTISMRGSLRLSCPAIASTDQTLAANTVYFFQTADDGKLALQEIDLRSDETTRGGRDLGNSSGWNRMVVIPVKLLVDEDQPMTRQAWETRLRARVEAASKIFTDLFRVQFEVVAVDTWKSSDSLTKFDDSLREFVRVVDPEPARLALGFTGQYSLLKQERHLGGVPAPLHTHILLREWGPQITEAERLEVLVHELGHFLGASHSPENRSVMRPILGDGLARRASFQIGFDPVNTLAMALITEELRHRQVATWSQVSIDTALRLRQLYRVLSEVQPDDPASRQYLELLKRIPGLPGDPADAPEPESAGQQWPIAATRQILQQLVAAAVANAARAESDQRPAVRPLVGDELTAHYVRSAAAAAAGLDPPTARLAVVLAIAIGLDHSEILRNNPLLSEFFRAVESPGERAERLRVLGLPTIHGRHDLLQHFAASAFLTATHNAQLAEAAGVAKEILDAHSTSGFSFADLAADYAGIAFASGVLSGSPPLAELAQGFTVPRFVPDVGELPEGLSWIEFTEQYGSFSDPRYQQLRRQILERLHGLPGYQRGPSAAETAVDH